MKKIAILTIAVFLMTASSAMAWLSFDNAVPINMGNKTAYIVDADFDSSYAYGGEPLSGVSLGMDQVDIVIPITEKEGYSFVYDHSNRKLRVLTKVPPIVYDEKISFTVGTGVSLMYPAAWVFNVVDGSGNNCQWIYSGATDLSTNQFALVEEIKDGVRTGVSADATDTYYVTYATQAWRDLYNLIVQNETVSVSASGTSATCVTSGNTIFSFGYARAGATSYTPIDFNDTALVSEVGVDFGSSGTSTSYLNFADHSGTASKVFVTYLKYPPSGTFLKNRLVTGVSFSADQGSVAGVSTVSFGYKHPGPILTWGYNGFLVSNGDTSQKLVRTFNNIDAATKVKWNYPAAMGTINASGVSHYVYGYGFGDPSSAVTPTNVAYTWGYPWEIPNLDPMEVPNGTDLSDLDDVKLLVIGH